MITHKKLKDVTVGELCDDRFQGCYYDDCPAEDCEGRPCQFWIEKEESCLVDVIRNQLGERLDDDIPIDPENGDGLSDVIEFGEYTFKPVGVDGIYICDKGVFEAPFDEGRRNVWKKSSGKKLLEKWFEENAPMGIKRRFDIDLPTVEEVFSQKMLPDNGCGYANRLISKQFPMFKDSDERMKYSNGGYVLWWTRSAFPDDSNLVWLVGADGGIDYDVAQEAYWFFPILRRKGK